MCRQSRLSMLIACSIAGIAVATSCSQETNAPQNGPTKEQKVQGLHQVNSSQLRKIMEQLRRLDLERLSNEVALGNQGADEKLEDVSRAASSLAVDARVIPMVFKNMEMSPESRRHFDELAAKLQVQCDDLRMLAKSHQPRGMKARLNAIIQTCNECHTSFRGPQMAARPGTNPMS